MGVDAGDFDNDGDEDLFVTNLTGEGNDLYVNDGNGLFEEQSARSGLGPASRGVHGIRHRVVRRRQRRLAGHDHRERRRPDHRGPAARQRSVSATPAQACCSATWATDGSRTSRRAAGRRSSCRRSVGARRSATSTTTATWTCWWPTTTARPRLLVNEIGSRNHWVGLRLVGLRRGHARRARRAWYAQTARRCGVGLDRTAATRRPTTRVCVVGLGQATSVARVRVIWPGGTTEEFDAPAIDRYTTLREGEGR